MIEVRRTHGEDPDALALVRAMEVDIIEPGYGPVTPERTSTVRPDELRAPTGAFVVVYEDGRAVAGGGVRRLEDGIGELKRMYTVPQARGRGHGRRVLLGLEAAARELGFRRLRLDSGLELRAALALYRSAGYVEIADYNGNSYADYWAEKVLG